MKLKKRLLLGLEIGATLSLFISYSTLANPSEVWTYAAPGESSRFILASRDFIILHESFPDDEYQLTAISSATAKKIWTVDYGTRSYAKVLLKDDQLIVRSNSEQGSRFGIEIDGIDLYTGEKLWNIKVGDQFSGFTEPFVIHGDQLAYIDQGDFDNGIYPSVRVFDIQKKTYVSQYSLEQTGHQDYRLKGVDNGFVVHTNFCHYDSEAPAHFRNYITCIMESANRKREVLYSFDRDGELLHFVDFGESDPGTERVITFDLKTERVSSQYLAWDYSDAVIYFEDSFVQDGKIFWAKNLTGTGQFLIQVRDQETGELVFEQTLKEQWEVDGGKFFKNRYLVFLSRDMTRNEQHLLVFDEDHGFKSMTLDLTGLHFPMDPRIFDDEVCFSGGEVRATMNLYCTDTEYGTFYLKFRFMAPLFSQEYQISPDTLLLVKKNEIVKYQF